MERPCLLWRLRSATCDLVQGHRSVYPVLLEGICALVLCNVLMYLPMVVLSRLPHFLAPLYTAPPTFALECNETAPKVDKPLCTTALPSQRDFDTSSFLYSFQYLALCDSSP